MQIETFSLLCKLCYFTDKLVLRPTSFGHNNSSVIAVYVLKLALSNLPHAYLAGGGTCELPSSEWCHKPDNDNNYNNKNNRSDVDCLYVRREEEEEG